VLCVYQFRHTRAALLLGD